MTVQVFYYLLQQFNICIRSFKLSKLNNQVFNLTIMAYLKFQRIKSKKQYNGPEREGHSVNYISKINSLLIWGGSKKTDVFTFQLSKKQWQFHKTSGKRPDSKKYHASYYVQSINCLIIHGGQTQKNSSNQCFVLDIDTWIWKKVFIQINLPSRQYHMIVPYNTKNGLQLFIFGGISLPYGKFLNDFWKIRNIQSLQIDSKLHQIEGSQWSLVDTKGKKPPGMFGYFAKIINNKFCVFGGRQPDAQKNFNIHTLCLKNYRWQLLNIENKLCPSLINFSVYQSMIQKNKFYIFGGIQDNFVNKVVYSFSFEKMKIVQENQVDKFQKIMKTSICQITEKPLCLGFVQWDNQRQDIQINIIMEQDSNIQASRRESHFATDQYENEISSSNQEVSIQDYLKAIKHEQILSQELISKNKCLEQIYKQMQRYITKLYQTYLKSGEYSQLIQKQKEKSIKRCQNLKQKYLQIEQDYSIIVGNIKNCRGQLGQIHQDFQRCMDTEVDQEIE